MRQRATARLLFFLVHLHTVTKQAGASCVSTRSHVAFSCAGHWHGGGDSAPMARVRSRPCLPFRVGPTRTRLQRSLAVPIVFLPSEVDGIVMSTSPRSRKPSRANDGGSLFPAETCSSGTADRIVSRSRTEGRPGFDRRMTKDEINGLPLHQFNQQIFLVQDTEQIATAVAYLRTEKLLGFDTETKPSFAKGERYLPSLLQLSGEKQTVLFHLSKVGFPPELQALLSDPAITKAGVAVCGDISKLQELANFKPMGFADLSDMATQAGVHNIGLRGLAAVLLGVRISKGQQRSNWGRSSLSTAQLNYAANDAWTCRELYLKFVQMQSR